MRFLAAATLDHAHRTATIDWGWQHYGRGQWIDHEGQRVRYLSHFEMLYGLEHGSVTIYLGWRYYKNQYFYDWRDVVKHRAYKTVEFVGGEVRPVIV